MPDLIYLVDCDERQEIELSNLLHATLEFAIVFNISLEQLSIKRLRNLFNKAFYNTIKAELDVTTD